MPSPPPLLTAAASFKARDFGTPLERPEQAVRCQGVHIASSSHSSSANKMLSQLSDHSATSADVRLSIDPNFSRARRQQPVDLAIRRCVFRFEEGIDTDKSIIGRICGSPRSIPTGRGQLIPSLFNKVNTHLGFDHERSQDCLAR